MDIRRQRGRYNSKSKLGKFAAGLARGSMRKRLREDEEDTVTVDVPLLIRLLEYAREDSKNDVDLHEVADKLIELSLSDEVLTMEHYESIIHKEKDPVAERIAELAQIRK